MTYPNETKIIWYTEECPRILYLKIWAWYLHRLRNAAQSFSNDIYALRTGVKCRYLGLFLCYDTQIKDTLTGTIDTIAIGLEIWSAFEQDNQCPFAGSLTVTSYSVRAQLNFKCASLGTSRVLFWGGALKTGPVKISTFYPWVVQSLRSTALATALLPMHSWLSCLIWEPVGCKMKKEVANFAFERGERSEAEPPLSNYIFVLGAPKSNRFV